MPRYTDEQKLRAVKAYREGAGGLRAIAKAHGVGFDSLRAWAAAYDAHGMSGLAAKEKVNYDCEFKLDVLSRMREEGLSSRQTCALFNIRRLDQVAEWSRVYAAHGAAALKPGWKQEQKTMSKTPCRRDDQQAHPDNQRSREELVRDLQKLRTENAYLKKVQALARTKSRSAPGKKR